MMRLRLLSEWLRLPIMPVPPGMQPAAPSDFSLQGLTQNVNKYAEAVATIVTAGTNVALTTAQVLAKNIVLTLGASGSFTITLPSTTTLLDALGPTMPLDGSFFFPLEIWNNGTTFTGTLTAGDSNTTLASPDNALATDTFGKWIVRVDPVVSSALGRPTELTITRVANGIAIGTAGTGTVTSISATTPIVVMPSPITSVGTVSHADSGVVAATYGDATHVPQVAVNATGHVTSVTNVAIAGGASANITATTPIVVTPDPITSAGTVSHAASGVAAATYGDATHVAQVAVNVSGHVTSASNVAITQGNSFETIAVSGQSDVVADSPTDTLTLIAGSNVTITTNAGTDSITINAVGSGSGSVTSITATSPIVVTPSPITTTGTVSHAVSGVTAASYGDATHVSAITVNATGHVTAAASTAIDFSGIWGWVWGSGADGVVNFDGTSTYSFVNTTGAAPNLVYFLNRSIYATNCTISPGITVNGYNHQLFCTGTFTVTGAGHWNADGTRNLVNNGIGGIGGGDVSLGGTNGIYLPATRGGDGGNGVAAATIGGASNGQGCTSGAGGAGGNASGGQVGKAGGIPNRAGLTGGAAMFDHLIYMLGSWVHFPGQNTSPQIFEGGTGGGGGGGNVGAPGGGGGGGGGITAIFAKIIAGDGTGSITAKGANGNRGDSIAPGGGGGGGGGGGCLGVVTTTSTWPALVPGSAAGGTGGVSGGAGANGANGADGRLVSIIMGT